MNIKIRKAKPEDWKIIQDLNHKIFFINSKFENYFNINWEYTQYGINYFKNMTSNKKEFTVIAYDNKKPIAYLNGHKRKFGYRKKQGKTVAEIENLGVLPAYQSKGVGKQLMDQFITWCKCNKISILSTNIYNKNTQALKFYEKLGFKPIDLSLEGKI